MPCSQNRRQHSRHGHHSCKSHNCKIHHPPCHIEAHATMQADFRLKQQHFLQQIALLTPANTRLEQRCSAYQLQHAHLHAQLDYYRNSLSSLSASSKQDQKELIKKVQQGSTETSLYISSLENMNSRLKNELAEATLLLRDIKTDFNCKISQTQLKKDNYSALHKQYKSISKERDNLRNTVLALQKQQAAKEDRHGAFLDELGREREIARKERDAMESKLNVLKQEKARLKSQIQKQTEATSLDREVKNKSEKLVSNQLKKVEERLKSVMLQLEESRRRCSTLQEELLLAKSVISQQFVAQSPGERHSGDEPVSQPNLLAQNNQLKAQLIQLQRRLKQSMEITTLEKEGTIGVGTMGVVRLENSASEGLQKLLQEKNRVIRKLMQEKTEIYRKLTCCKCKPHT